MTIKAKTQIQKIWIIVLATFSEKLVDALRKRDSLKHRKTLYPSPRIINPVGKYPLCVRNVAFAQYKDAYAKAPRITNSRMGIFRYALTADMAAIKTTSGAKKAQNAVGGMSSNWKASKKVPDVARPIHHALINAAWSR